MIDWKLTVSRAIIIVRKPAPKNMVMGTVVLKANPSSQFEVKYNATGSAIILAIMIKSKNSLFSICIILKTVAPRTFLMPISLVFSCAVYVHSPRSPRQEISIAMMAKKLNNVPCFCSLIYCCW
ncbi:hypothetical protein D3C81_1142140 [compost metagenome]